MQYLGCTYLECRLRLSLFMDSRLGSSLLNSSLKLKKCFIADEMLEHLPLASRVGKTLVGGIDLNKTRMRQGVEALIVLSPSPNGFTAPDVAARVGELSKQTPLPYGPRHAAYDLKKLRGKQNRPHPPLRATSARSSGGDRAGRPPQ
jgi:hypothetical protein